MHLRDDAASCCDIAGRRDPTTGVFGYAIGTFGYAIGAFGYAIGRLGYAVGETPVYRCSGRPGCQCWLCTWSGALLVNDRISPEGLR